MGTPGKERIRAYRQRKKKKTGGKNLSVFISAKIAEQMESIKKENKIFTNLDIIEKAIESYGSSKQIGVSVPLDEKRVRQFEFLRNLKEDSNETILGHALSEYYDYYFTVFIRVKANEIHEAGYSQKRQEALKELLFWLYKDTQSEKEIKKYLNQLNIPPYGTAWKVGKVRDYLSRFMIE